MSDGLSFCDKCLTDIESTGIVQCNGMDTEMNVPLVSLYHSECYATLTEQDNVPTCTDCVDSPCFIKRKSMK